MAVRREKVIVEVEDRLSGEMLRMAASAKVLDKALDGVDGSNVGASRSTDRLASSTRKASPEIDRLSGRLRLFRDIGITLGPAFAPIGAVAIPAIAGLAAQLGAIALAGGTAVVAFQGVGDALKAVNDAALEPTAANLEKAREALRELGPEAQQFVLQMQELRPVFDGLSDAAGRGLFPGLTAAFDQFEKAAPRIEGVLEAIGGATGDMVNDFASGLTGSRGMEFLEFIRTEVPGALEELGRTVGQFSAGLAEMWMAFTPLNRDFSAWMLDVATTFDDWAQGLADSEGFESFIAYIRENGPRVAEALGGIGNALVSLVEAVAPLGGPTLIIIEGIADSIAALAGSDAGPAIMAAVTAMTLLSRSTQAFGKVAESSWGMSAKGANGALAQFDTLRSTAIRGTAALAGFSLAMLDVGDDSTAAGRALETFSGVASSALLGFAAGGPAGLALGTGIGLMSQMTQASAELTAELAAADDAIASLDVERMKQAIASLLPEAAFGDESAAAKIRKLGTAMAATEGETVGLASATYSLAKVANRSAAVAERQAAALHESRQAAREVAESFLDLSHNADNAKVSLAGYIRGLERQAEALRDFRINAEKAAENGLRKGLIRELQELGPVGALRMKQFANATEDEIRRANKAHQSFQNETRKTTDAIGGVRDASPVNVQINANAGAALGALGAVSTGLRNLNGDTATVYIKAQRSALAGAALGGGFADGGWTGPGRKHDVAGAVHRDEFVFSKEATHGNVAMLESLHRKMRGFSDGGWTGGSVSVGSPNVSVGSPNVTVLIDGREVRAIVQHQNASDRAYQSATSARSERGGFQ